MLLFLPFGFKLTLGIPKFSYTSLSIYELKWKQVSWEQRWHCQTAEMLCWIVGFGWLKYYQGCYWKTSILCHETTERRGRSHYLLIYQCCSFQYYAFLLTMSYHPSPGNNIYDDDIRENLLRLQKEGNEEDAAYILMQRIFPTVSPTFLMREGICHRDNAISELGIYGAYLRYMCVTTINIFSEFAQC